MASDLEVLTVTPTVPQLKLETRLSGCRSLRDLCGLFCSSEFCSFEFSLEFFRSDYQTLYTAVF